MPDPGFVCLLVCLPLSCLSRQSACVSRYCRGPVSASVLGRSRQPDCLAISCYMLKCLFGLFTFASACLPASLSIVSAAASLLLRTFSLSSSYPTSLPLSLHVYLPPCFPPRPDPDARPAEEVPGARVGMCSYPLSVVGLVGAKPESPADPHS